MSPSNGRRMKLAPLGERPPHSSPMRFARKKAQLQEIADHAAKPSTPAKWKRHNNDVVGLRKRGKSNDEPPPSQKEIVKSWVSDQFQGVSRMRSCAPRAASKGRLLPRIPGAER